MVSDRRVGLPGDVHETSGPAFGLEHQVGDLLLGQVEEVVEELDRRGTVLDQLRVDRDRGRRYRHREFVAVTVEDRAALGGYVVRPGPLARAGRPQCVGLLRLQEHHAADDRDEHDGDGDERDDQPPSRRGVGRGRRATGRWRLHASDAPAWMARALELRPRRRPAKTPPRPLGRPLRPRGFFRVAAGRSLAGRLLAGRLLAGRLLAGPASPPSATPPAPLRALGIGR